MAYQPNQLGTNPKGDAAPIPVGGVSFQTTTPLSANASINTGWMDRTGFNSLLYVIRADQPSATGGIVIEYSYNGTTAIAGGSSSSYQGTDVGQLFQTALAPKGNFVRFTYTNGATAQGSFWLETQLSPDLSQSTLVSINKTLTQTNLAMAVKAVLELDNGSGSIDTVTRTGNAMNVNVTNQPSSNTDYAKDGTDGTGITAPTGGVGIRGWLSGIFQKISATLSVSLVGSSTATVTTQTTLATVTTILAANPNRKGAKFTSVTGTILIKYGSAASATSYTERIVTNGSHELAGPEPYKGIVTAIGAGTLNVTEW
jgi:hypothetical protein